MHLQGGRPLPAIRKFADEHPDNKWIAGCDFSFDEWEEQPTKEMLDEAVPDRPAYFASWDMHIGWMNSKALESIGYMKDTPTQKAASSFATRTAIQRASVRSRR